MIEQTHEVTSTSNRVEAWSITRLPFEPKGWLIGYRQALRDSLRAIEPLDSGLLHAEYATPDRDFADLENVLLYNLGAGTYGHLASNGLACTRVESADHLHRVTYEVTDHGPDAFSGKSLATAYLETVPPAEKAGQWWALFRSVLRVQSDAQHSGEYAVTVELGEGWRKRGWVSKVKPMLDGLISALHVHDGTNRDHVTANLDEYGDGSDLWSLLNESSAAILGERRLVRPHGPGIAWNPADELCSAFMVTFRGNADDVSVVVTDSIASTESFR